MTCTRFAVPVLLAACARPPVHPAPLPVAARLTDTLEVQFTRSAAAWNRGDLDGFVGDFVSRGHVRRGYDWIRGNYAPRFALGAQRDSLRFEELAVRWLEDSP